MTSMAEAPVDGHDEVLTRRALRHALDKTTDMAESELRVPLHYYRDPKITEIEESQVLRRVPLAIVNKAHQANQLYPFAISLIESVRTYEGTDEVHTLIIGAHITGQSAFS